VANFNPVTINNSGRVAFNAYLGLGNQNFNAVSFFAPVPIAYALD
jgi:hypothetical protein